MIYDIQMKNDISSGAVLIVRFPEEDIDKKALYTIQSDQPDFLVPFLLRNVDGYAECTYRLGMRSELRHRFGSHSAKEYVKLWTNILQPLLECEDWFLQPSSFVLNTDYLYVDKLGNVISYIYIPSKRECMEADALKSMVTELSNKNSTNDQKLENQVWRALAQDFQPGNFLQMLSESTSAPVHEEKKPVVKPQDWGYAPVPPMEPNLVPQGGPVNPAPKIEKKNDIEIIIEPEPKPKKKGLFGSKKEKSAKKEKPEKKGFWNKSKNSEGQYIGGAASEQLSSEQSFYTPPKAQLPAEPISIPGVIPEVNTEGDETQLFDDGVEGISYLRLVGDNSLPRMIPVSIQPGQSFTIGRFDASVGHKQADFEFEKRTKAVSRHHAVIERSLSGEYQLKDLASSAGTFLNGTRLTPNVAYPITRNDKIAFGTCGADYVWEA